MSSESSSEQGKKQDGGKPRYDLLPPYALHQVVQAYTVGAEKYADNNWKKGLRFSRMFGSLLRHAFAWWRGETFDKDNGQHHLAAVAFCAMGLIELEVLKPELDDRDPSYKEMEF
jgi:hypothetical protein